MAGTGAPSGLTVTWHKFVPTVMMTLNQASVTGNSTMVQTAMQDAVQSLTSFNPTTGVTLAPSSVNSFTWSASGWVILSSIARIDPDQGWSESFFMC
jgi:hypothetical protein